MTEVYFQVSFVGTLVFRTDVFTSVIATERAAGALRVAFKRADGFLVERFERDAAWTSSKVL
jgi:hypothetical protein